MPKYTFVCHNCGEQKTQYAPVSITEFPCGKCDSAMIRQLPSSGSQEVTEKIDDFTGVTRTQDSESLNKERREQHYWEVEVPRFIETYSTETCIEQGWLVYNDKGELVINKPPSKR